MNTTIFGILAFLLSAMLAISGHTGQTLVPTLQEPTPAPMIVEHEPASKSVIVDPPFRIQSVTEKVLYAGVSEQIAANGKTYLAFDEAPTRVMAAIIAVEGNATGYIEVSKVGSSDFPAVIDEFAPGRYLYEHSGKGVYHIRSLDSNGRPVYDKFEIKTGTDPPPVDPVDPPPVDPPTGDHAELARIVQDKAPKDHEVALALSGAYETAISEASAGSIDLEAARQLAEQKRRDVLMALPPLKDNWNEFLLAAGQYLVKLETKADYLAALQVLSDALKEVKTASQPAAQSSPAIQAPEILMKPVPLRQPVLRRVWIPAGCDGFGNCWSGHWEYR